MLATLSSHILDTQLGKPAAGIKVTLHQLHLSSSNNERVKDYLADGVTDTDGRISSEDWNFDSTSGDKPLLTPGNYSLTFGIEPYFNSQDIQAFYPEVVINFVISDASHYHIPLLLSTYGYSTYRGS